MKRMKQLTSVVLALVLALALAVPAMAANSNAHTITITNEMSGHTYEAYQIFKGDLATDGKTLTNIEWGSGVDTVKKVTIDSNEYTLIAAIKAKMGEDFASVDTAEDVAAKLSGKPAEVADQFAEIVGLFLSTTVAGTSTEAKGETSSTYTINVTGDGYYMVKDQDNSVTAEGDSYTKYILQVVENVSVTAKADAPELEKKIKEGDTKVDANNGSVGDTVNYELTSRVPSMDGYSKYFFIIHDTLSAGLTFNKDVAITIGDKTLAADVKDENGNVTEMKDFSVNISGQNVEIVLRNFIQYKAQAGAAITITYSATINENAVVGNVGNPNTAHLEYSNNPNVNPSGDPTNPDKPGDGDVTGETPRDTVVTYVTGIELTKVDKDNNRLTGAEFKITGEKLNKVKTVKEVFTVATDGTFYLLKDGTYTTTAPADETKDKYADTTKKYTKSTETVWNTTTEKVSATAVVGSDGVLRFEGLAEGTYTITEITAPDGYNMLKQPITVVITCEEPTTINTAADPATWKYYVSGAVVEGAADNKLIATDGIVHISVINQAGLTLPETGGMGTTIFYVLGTILVLGAGVLLIAKKRMSVED